MIDQQTQFEIVEGRELRLVRLFDARRETVWQAWTDPRHLTRWWGPQGFSTTTEVMQVVPGGIWRFVMHGPDGRNYPNLITYIEVVEPERIVYRHVGEEGVEPVRFRVTVTFAEETGVPDGTRRAGLRRTRVTMSMLFDTPEELELVDREYGAIEGALQTLARLAVLLKEIAE